MDTVLDFPPLDNYLPPPAAAPVAIIEPVAVPATIKDTVLAQFVATEADLLALAAKYKDVAYDVTTTRGMAEATAARMDLRENGRYLVQRAEKRIKADVNDLKRVMADEVERLVAIVRPVEDAIDAQIKAREAVLAAEKAERDRIEAERVERHTAFIRTIRSYVDRCRELDMTAERIARGIASLEQVTIGPEREEFQPEATMAQVEALQAMRGLLAAATSREAEAARLELQRIEQARVAAEQAAERDRIAAETAEIRRQAAELAAQRAESDRLEKLAEERRAEIARQESLAAQVVAEAPADDAQLVPGCAEIVATPEGDRGPVDTYLPPSASAPPLNTSAIPPMLNLSDINRRLGIVSVTAATLAAFGIEPLMKVKASVMYDAACFPRLCDALIAHIQGVK
jgi:predicted phage tail protein